jgi:type IX secretion system PorP/SprF family membrane protein
MKKYTLFLCWLAAQTTAFTQDSQFSDYTYSKLSLNPAWVATQTEPYEIASQYRNQWSPVLGAAAYNTVTSSATFWRKQGIYSHSRWGGGAQFAYDRAGSAGLSQTQAHLAGFYSKYITDSDFLLRNLRHRLTLGSTFGFLQNRIDDAALRWVEQYENGSFNPSLNPPMYLENNRKRALDVNVGLLWHAYNPSKQGFEIGLGLFHLNKPNMSWTAQPNYVPLRMTLLAQVTHDIWNHRAQINYYGHFLKQSVAYQVNGGAKIAFKLKMWRLSCGTGLRFTSGLMPFESLLSHLSLSNEQFELALNHDFTLGSLRPANHFNNAIEIGIRLHLQTPPSE